MKKRPTYYVLGLIAIAVFLIAGLLAVPKSWSLSPINTVNAESVTEKTEKISSGLPLWHAVPRLLFRRY